MWRVAGAVALLLAVFVAAAPQPAFAQDAQDPWWSPFRIDRTIFNPEMFTQLIVSRIADNPAITTWIRRIAVLLTAFLFLWNLYMALAYQSPGAVTDALIRAAIVGTIMANLPFVSGVMVDFHRALSAIGTAVFDALGGATAFDQALSRLQQAIEQARSGMLQLGLFDAVRFIFILIYSAAITILFLVFMVLAIAIYNFLLFGSYLALAIAVLVMPLSLACLASRATQSFVYEWLQVILHSALVAMLAKAAAGIIVNVAVADRITQYADAILAAGGDFEKTLLAIAGWKELVPAICMLAIGIFTLLNVHGLASAFVGRVESVAGALAGLYFAARAVSGPARAAVATVTPRGVWGLPTLTGAWQWARSRPEAVASAVSAGVLAARYQTHRAATWLAAHGGPVGSAVAERLGVDRTLPGPLSPDHYAALQEIQESTRRFYEAAEQDLRALGYTPQPSVVTTETPDAVDLSYRPTGGLEPTDEDMPTEPHFQPDWPPRD